MKEEIKEKKKFKNSAIKKESHRNERRSWRNAVKDLDSIEDDDRFQVKESFRKWSK